MDANGGRERLLFQRFALTSDQAGGLVGDKQNEQVLQGFAIQPQHVAVKVAGYVVKADRCSHQFR